MAAMTFDRRQIPADARISMTPARDGWPLRTYRQPARGPQRGAILWLGGRGDIFEKYLESFDEWAAAGWSVTSFDWRGQGGSGRMATNPRIGHADDFAPWIDDLAAFCEDWTREHAGPHVIMGHSMGGHLLLRACAESRIAPDGVVLSAPMLGFDAGIVPFAVTAWAARAIAAVTTRETMAWKDNERPATHGASRQSFLTFDDDRYADEIFWHRHDPSLVLGPPNWRWVAASYRSIAGLRRAGAVEAITTPVLIVATAGDKLVSAAATRAFAARIAGAQLIMLGTDVAHEVLRERDEPRTKLMMAIGAFMDSLA
jgi:lysophospholipase